MDFFLDDPAKTLDIPWLLSKYGGQRDSMYEVVDGEDKKLDITTHINKVGRALFKTDIFKRRVADESRLRLVDAGTAREVDMPYIKRRKMSGAEIYENRLRTINEILTDPALSNQQKLAFYAGWSEYKGTEFAEYLELAGDMGLDAASVVKLLENPGEHNNYHNVRAFLLQSLKSSEARIKREEVKELICGEWYVEAEYGGKVCRFQMMPVDEIVAFKQAIENLHFDEASDTRYVNDYINGYFGEEISYIGFPSDTGTGAVVEADEQYLLSAKSEHLEGAWEFVRYYLTEEYQREVIGFPVNKMIFEERAMEATKSPYTIDRNGNKQEYEYKMSIGGESVVLPNMTTEQVDEFIEFVESIDKCVYYDEDIEAIINEEVALFFAGQKSASDVARVIQSRVEIYVNESR